MPFSSNYFETVGSNSAQNIRKPSKLVKPSIYIYIKPYYKSQKGPDYLQFEVSNMTSCCETNIFHLHDIPLQLLLEHYHTELPQSYYMTAPQGMR